MTKAEILARIDVIEDMTETEGVKQICVILRALAEQQEDKTIGFKAE